MLSYREALFGILRKNDNLRENVHVSRQNGLLLEVRAILKSAAFSRRHGLKQRSLTAASYLSTLVPICEDVGMHIEAAAQWEMASTLWEQDEVVASTKMLQTLSARKDLSAQSIPVGRAGILAQLVGSPLTLFSSPLTGSPHRDIRLPQHASKSQKKFLVRISSLLLRTFTMSRRAPRQDKSFMSSPNVVISNCRIATVSKTSKGYRLCETVSSEKREPSKQCTRPHRNPTIRSAKKSAGALERRVPGSKWMTTS